MTTKVGINCFGRIGRCLARIITDERDDLEEARRLCRQERRVDERGGSKDEARLLLQQEDQGDDLEEAGRL